jgi:hypothetical protein
MKSVCRFLVLVPLVLGTACQRGDTSSQEPAKTPVAPPTAEYAADIGALCDCIARSGAADDDSRTLTIANWLAANLKTAESRKFLVQIQPLGGEAKARALEDEAHRVGLPACALATEWRNLPAVN